jgi:Cu+-exporting ATPase
MRGIPNMNVLIAVGGTAAFVYSLIGTLGNLGEDYLFYETAATIFTLVFLGEYVEHRSIVMTQRSLNELARHQRVTATMIGFDDKHQENFFAVENTDLRVGDLILIRSGEQVPMDCRILSGDAQVSEALLTGESTPIQKGKKDTLIGGSLILDGVIRAQVAAVGSDTVLSNILNLVKQAQSEKPPVQQLADKISAVFVPAVIGIAAVTFLVNYFWVDVGLTPSIMRSIAVLVISCPCAMGLATPAAIAVGLGRAAKNGILFRNAKSLELFKDIRTVIFDKTGTLTEGRFRITRFEHGTMPEADFKQLVVSIEKYSTHPIAAAIVSEWNTNNLRFFTRTEEIKGKGMEVTDADGTVYRLFSERWARSLTAVPTGHQVYVLRNSELVGWLDLDDEIRPESAEVVRYLHDRGIRTILLSGDSQERCEALEKRIGITEVIAGQSPEQKLDRVTALTAAAPTAMVGDGINDAPALAKATIGISMSESTQLALQTAQVVLMKQGIKNLPLALGLGKHTFKTIQGNLFWAFIYNIVAIPIAAFGFLAPGLAALTMGFSDVVLAINSIRLNYKRVL